MMECLMAGPWCIGLALILLLFATWYFWQRHRYGHFVRRGLPHVVPDYFMEFNLFALFLPDGQSTGDVYDRLYKKLKAQVGHRGYGGFFHLYTPSYLITSPEMVTKITVRDFLHFADHGPPVDEEVNPLEANLFTLSGPKWRALRRKLTPTFTSGKLKWMFTLIEECGHKFVQTLDQEADTGNEIEMRDILSRFTADVIGSCAFGIDLESLKHPDSQFRKMGHKFFNPPLKQVLMTVVRFSVPWFFKKFKIRTTQRDVDDFFMSTISQALEYRKTTGAWRNDLVQLLLQLKETGKIEYDQDDPLTQPEEEDVSEEMEPVHLELTDEVLAAQAFIFFIAGYETTASTMSYTLYLLAKHQDVQEKARRNVKEVMEKYGGNVTYEALKDMIYLEACVNESMRLYPAVQLLPRSCSKDCKMDDGNVIYKGQPIIIPVFSIHRDPDHFEEPLEFRPERFMPWSQPPKPGTFIPFGFGPRICIAQRFALLEIKLCLAMMLNKYRFKTGPSMTEPLKLVSQSFLAFPKGGIKLIVKTLDDDENVLG